jgi:hypothetical protein
MSSSETPPPKLDISPEELRNLPPPRGIGGCVLVILGIVGIITFLPVGVVAVLTVVEHLLGLPTSCCDP